MAHQGIFVSSVKEIWGTCSPHSALSCKTMSLVGKEQAGFSRHTCLHAHILAHMRRIGYGLAMWFFFFFKCALLMSITEVSATVSCAQNLAKCLTRSPPGCNSKFGKFCFPLYFYWVSACPEELIWRSHAWKVVGMLHYFIFLFFVSRHILLKLSLAS